MSFSLDIQKFAEKAAEKADEAVGRIVTAIHAEIDMRSPVDTGRFRANWQLGVNAAPGGVLAKFDKNGGDTRARISAAIPDEASGNVYFLSNNLPYAMRLEHGYSKQAPTGMVGLTVTRFQSIVDEAVGAVQ